MSVTVYAIALSIVTIIFSGGISWGISKVKQENLEKTLNDHIENDKEFQRKTDLFMNDSCGARMKSLNESFRRYLFNEDGTPKIVHTAVCEKNNNELEEEIKTLIDKIANRDDKLAGVLNKIHDEIKNGGGSQNE